MKEIYRGFELKRDVTQLKRFYTIYYNKNGEGTFVSSNSIDKLKNNIDIILKDKEVYPFRK